MHPHVITWLETASVADINERIGRLSKLISLGDNELIALNTKIENVRINTEARRQALNALNNVLKERTNS